LAVAIVGVASAAAWGVRSVNDANARADAFPSTALPGTVTVQITDPGDQMIYFTGSGNPSADALALKVEGPAGTAVPTVSYDLALQVDLAGDAGTAIATFAADKRGTYRVTSSAVSHSGVIAVGDNVSTEVLPRMLGALALMSISLGAAIIIVVVTLVRRSSRAS
jgi:hypothetical protein